MPDCKLEDSVIREELEGFLGDDFNGVIFLLREPNTDGREADGFWFKNCLKGQIPDGKDPEAYKGNFDKYKDKFETMLKYIGADVKLGQAAYFNLRPGSGRAERTHEYDRHLHDTDYVANRFAAILNYCESKAQDNRLTFFACSDIADALLKKKREEQILRKDPYVALDIQKTGGVLFRYGEGPEKRIFPKRRILCKTKEEGLQITIYEIHHPSAYSKVEPKEDHA